METIFFAAFGGVFLDTFPLETAFAGTFLAGAALAGAGALALAVFAGVFLAGAAFGRAAAFLTAPEEGFFAVTFFFDGVAAGFFTGFTRAGEDFDVFPADFTVFLGIFPPDLQCKLTALL